MSPTTTEVDRAAAVRSALRQLVAERGFHGASMSAVAAEARVAAGTAYTYYASKDDLVLATYVETKADLGAAATRDLDPSLSPRQRFLTLWRNVYEHLRDDPTRARFLVQLDSSPYAEAGHELVMSTEGDRLQAAAATPDMAEVLIDLPPEVLFDLGLGPAVRLAGRDHDLTDEQLETVAAACWAAITR